MRAFGWVVLVFAGLLGFYALSMNTSVDTGDMFGRVNNIGLMNDKQNYLMVAGACFIGGLLMVIFGGRDGASALTQAPASKMSDPFDEIDAEAQNERKRDARVWVNGQLVYADGRSTGRRPGTVIRRQR